jgi:AraC family transcriptional activator of pobA
MKPASLAFAPRRADALPLEVLQLGGGNRNNKANAEFDRPPHSHRFYELLYVTKSTGWHRVGLERGEVGPGHLLVVAPGEVHDTRGLTQVSGWLVIFEAAALEHGERRFVDLPGELAFLPFVRGARAPSSFIVPKSARSDWERRLGSLFAELHGHARGREVVARAELEALLVHAARLVAAQVGFGVVQRPLLSEVFQFIDQRFERPISLVDVARAVKRSPAYLTTLVRTETGRSVLQWITERRMAEARRLLQQTLLDAAEIGERVGFSDPSYFVRRFRALHRVTPLAFRRRAQR